MRSSARFNNSTLTRFSPRNPKVRPSVYRSISVRTRATLKLRALATRFAWHRDVRTETIERAGVVHALGHELEELRVGGRVVRAEAERRVVPRGRLPV